MTCEASVYPNDEKVYNIMLEQDVSIDLKYILDDIYEHIRDIILKYELNVTILQCLNILTLDERKEVNTMKTTISKDVVITICEVCKIGGGYLLLLFIIMKIKERKMKK